MKFNDLLTQDLHDQGAELNVIDPETGKPSDSFICVVGVDSKLWQKMQKAAMRKILEARDLAIKEGREFVIDESMTDIGEVDRLVGATTGWRGFQNENGEEMPFTPENCKILYAQAPSVRAQVNFFIGDRVNFTRG